MTSWTLCKCLCGLYFRIRSHSLNWSPNIKKAENCAEEAQNAFKSQAGQMKLAVILWRPSVENNCLRCDCRPRSQNPCCRTSSEQRCEWLIPPSPAPSTCMPNSEYTKLEMWWGHHLARRVLNGLMSCWRRSSCSLFVTHPTNRDDRHQDDGGGGVRALWHQSHSTISGQVSLCWRHVEPTPSVL